MACQWIERSVLAACGASVKSLTTLPPDSRVSAPSTAGTSAAPWRSRRAMAGMPRNRVPCARVKAGVAHTSSVPVPYCGGNSAGAASIPTTWKVNGAGLPSLPSSDRRSVPPTPTCSAVATVKDMSACSAAPGSGRRPASSFLCHIVPGTAPPAGARTETAAG